MCKTGVETREIRDSWWEREKRRREKRGRWVTWEWGVQDWSDGRELRLGFWFYTS